MLHEARESLLKVPLKWKVLQEGLIERHIYIEKRILANKKQINEIQRDRKNPERLLSKEDSLAAKNLIAYLEYQIEEYHWLRSCFKSVGDGIAFSFISRYDIKPQAFKEDAGFISGKSGFRAEKRFFKEAFENGMIAILHDLTSVLRFRDISIVDSEGYLPIEVKASKNRNKRVVRQEENSGKVFDYLQNDETDGLFDVKEKMKRVVMELDRDNHIPLLNRLIEKSSEKGYAGMEAEPGLYYLIGHKEDEFQKRFSEVIKLFKAPMVNFLNEKKFTNLGYFPFSLSIKDPIEYIRFLEGEMLIVILIDQSVMVKLAREHNFEMSTVLDSDGRVKFRSLVEDGKVKEFSVSVQLLDRIPMEFNSLKKTFEEMFGRFSSENEFSFKD